MLNLPHDLYTAAQIRELERIVAEDHNISFSELMTRAGASALSTIKQQWPKAERILVLCGTGNNGGDGFELARQALADNYRVEVIQIGDDKLLTKIAFDAKDALLSTGKEIQGFQEELPPADVIVDAIFGTGINRPVEGQAKEVIQAINKPTGIPILSLDMPSGLHADTGNPQGLAVKATSTLNFIGLNIGLLTGHGPHYSGEIYFDSLDTPITVYKQVTPTFRRLNLEKDGERLAPRERTGHKGLYGHLVIIGGDIGMSGAVRIAAEAGARVGSGLTSIATRQSHSALINLTRPELMSHSVESPEELNLLLKQANALTIGPGLGQSDWAKALFEKAAEAILPMVVDADALNLLSKNRLHSDNWILTPHPGEAGRLLDCSSAEIQADRYSAVQEIQNIYGGVVVLKGPGTLINNGEALTRLSISGNPGMSTGGMGDVLAGVIGGLLAQGFPLMEAACVGVTLHGMAGDKAANQDGERGMLAMDLMPHLRQLSNSIR
ncbi:MAG: NAD(P)H-hydrate dehydratase [Piscirickettsiaceae bacterium]|nr:NAD(P)H-hydrate dehydratase [Piscirickettsiaceae bacterium]